jgi:hypothetical protein
MAVVLSLLVNTVLNVLIFKHVRASTRRVQPQTIGTNSNNNNIQHARISRRDISLLKQMIFMFCTFIGGWTPVYAILVINIIITLNPLIFRYSATVCEMAMLAIAINLFKCNHEIKDFLIIRIRRWVRR